MPRDLTNGVGFVHPTVRTGMVTRRCTELIATIGLALCLVVALTAVSIGLARADTLGIMADVEGGGLALPIAIMLALIMVGMGLLTALMSRTPSNVRRR